LRKEHAAESVLSEKNKGFARGGIGYDSWGYVLWVGLFASDWNRGDENGTDIFSSGLSKVGNNGAGAPDGIKKSGKGYTLKGFDSSFP
jgi:hypothetical protein